MASESTVAITAGSGTLMDVVTFSTTNREVIAVGDATTQANFLLIDAAGAALTLQKPAATPAVTGITASATSGTILASNTARLGATIQNDSTSATLYLRLGSTAAAATSGNYTVSVPAGGYYEVPFRYTGQITGIWATATGFANVTELTA